MVWRWVVIFFVFYVILICILSNKSFSVCVNFFSGTDMLMIYILIPSNLDLSILLTLVNSVDPKIQFTLEVEENNSLLFLDVLVSKHSDRYSTAGYRNLYAVSLPLYAF